MSATREAVERRQGAYHLMRGVGWSRSKDFLFIARKHSRRVSPDLILLICLVSEERGREVLGNQAESRTEKQSGRNLDDVCVVTQAILQVLAGGMPTLHHQSMGLDGFLEVG